MHCQCWCVCVPPPPVLWPTRDPKQQATRQGIWVSNCVQFCSFPHGALPKREAHLAGLISKAWRFCGCITDSRRHHEAAADPFQPSCRPSQILLPWDKDLGLTCIQSKCSIPESRCHPPRFYQICGKGRFRYYFKATVSKHNAHYPTYLESQFGTELVSWAFNTNRECAGKPGRCKRKWFRVKGDNRESQAHFQGVQVASVWCMGSTGIGT